MVLIAARLGDNVHLRTERVANLGAVAAVGEINFLDAIDAAVLEPGLFVTFRFVKAVNVAAAGALPWKIPIEFTEPGAISRKSITSLPLIGRLLICEEFRVVPDVLEPVSTVVVVPVTSIVSWMA